MSSQRAGRQTPGWRDDQVDLRFTQEACQWMRRQEAPFLLYLALASPHHPCTPPDFIRGRSDAGSRGDMVALVDWVVGQITDTLADLGVADDTLLIVTSDNGAMYADFRSPDTHGHASNGPWRGQKADIWDGGHREPFVARFPGVIPAGSERDDPVGLVDLLPTIARVVGSPTRPSVEDGRDILRCPRRVGRAGPRAGADPPQPARGVRRTAWPLEGGVRYRVRRLHRSRPASSATPMASCTTSTPIRRRRRTCGRSIPRWSPTWPASWR